MRNSYSRCVVARWRFFSNLSRNNTKMLYAKILLHFLSCYLGPQNFDLTTQIGLGCRGRILQKSASPFVNAFTPSVCRHPISLFECALQNIMISYYSLKCPVWKRRAGTCDWGRSRIQNCYRLTRPGQPPRESINNVLFGDLTSTLKNQAIYLCHLYYILKQMHLK